MHFWDAGQCGFHLMMDRSFSFSPPLAPVSLALSVGAIKGKLTEREIQHGRFQTDEKISLHPLRAAEAIPFHHSANKH